MERLRTLEGAEVSDVTDVADVADVDDGAGAGADAEAEPSNSTLSTVWRSPLPEQDITVAITRVIGKRNSSFLIVRAKVTKRYSNGK